MNSSWKKSFACMLALSTLLGVAACGNSTEKQSAADSSAAGTLATPPLISNPLPNVKSIYSPLLLQLISPYSLDFTRFVVLLQVFRTSSPLGLRTQCNRGGSRVEVQNKRLQIDFGTFLICNLLHF